MIMTALGSSGSLILDLYTEGSLNGALVDEIERRLERVPFGPQNVSVGQFGILVKRQIASGQIVSLAADHGPLLQCCFEQ